jgi:death-on-curing protein
VKIQFLTLAEINELHGLQIEAFGGSPEVRDFDLLRSALEMPAAGMSGQYFHEFPHEMAAAYLFHICAIHPFVDGNKRTSLHAALTFLAMNGLRLEADHAEVVDLVLGVATGKLPKAAVAAFFKTRIRPL